MATATKPKPGAKGGLNKKVAGIPVKFLVAGAILVVAYLVYRRYKTGQTTSAGSNATPSATQGLSTVPQDSTGGGSGGGGADTGQQQQPQGAQQQIPPIYTYYLGGQTPPAGGNTSPAAVSFSSQPTTSFVTPIDVTPAGQTQYGGAEPVIAAGTTIPRTVNQPYTTPIAANRTGGSATRRQGVITVH